MTAKRTTKGGSRSGGSMMSFRSGFKRVTGQGKKKRGKQEASFIQVLGWVVALALVLIAVWQLRGG